MNEKQQEALLRLYQRAKNHEGDLQRQAVEDRHYLFISRNFHHQTAKALQRMGLLTIRTYLNKWGADTDKKIALLTEKGRAWAIDHLENKK